MAQAESDAERVAGRAAGGFWTVVFALLIVMAFSTMPSPLYGLYRIRDHLSAFTITVVYAVFAVGTIVTLRIVGAIADRIGHRGMMVSAVATMMLAAGLLAAWKGLPGLLLGRLLTGVAVGLASGTAVTYLIELRVRADPNAPMVWARNIGTAVTVGALGIGPLIAGGLAQWAKWPLTLPYLVFIVLGAATLAALGVAPETGAQARRTATTRARLSLAAGAATLAAFAANGLFAGLSGLFLSTTLHHPSHALAGAALFLVFMSGVAAQTATNRLGASKVLGIGTVCMIAGLVLLVVAVRLPIPDLALFLIGGALIGAGSGAVFKGTTALVLDAAPPEARLAMTSALLIALFVGLSVPVIGAGIALDQGASPPDTVLGFAVLAGLGVCASGWALLSRRSETN